MLMTLPPLTLSSISRPATSATRHAPLGLVSMTLVQSRCLISIAARITAIPALSTRIQGALALFLSTMRPTTFPARSSSIHFWVAHRLISHRCLLDLAGARCAFFALRPRQLLAHQPVHHVDRLERADHHLEMCD